MDTVQIAQKGKKQMIEVKNLTKYYGNHKAVDHISFSIKEGTVCGFLGPNGAGKSTTMNIMTGCLSATSGNVSIGEYDIFEQPIEAKKMIGYLPEQPPLYLEETPREYLRFVAQAKKIPRESIREEIENVMKETQITEVADRLIKNLSKGYRQRVGIAQTLLGNPKVIILDEPTVGLDPIQVIEIRDLIKSLGQKHTVILSSHILSEVQHMCDEILIISKGRLIAYDTAENLEKMMAPRASIEVLTDASLEESVIPMCLIIAYPLILKNYGNIYLPTAYGTLFAYIMTAAALLSIGIFISSITESQAMAAGICFAAMLLNYYMVTLAEYVASSAYGSFIAILILELIIALLVKNMTGNSILSKGFGAVSIIAAVALYIYKNQWFEGLFPKILENISVYERFYEFVDGIFDYTHVVYFISVIVFFLFLTVQSLEKRRYN